MNNISFTKDDFKEFTSSEEFALIENVETIIDLINLIKRRYLNDNAFALGNQTLVTYQKFLNDVNVVCKELNNLKVEKHTNIGILFENSYEFAVASFGVMSYGCCAVLLPMQLDNQTIFGCSMKYNLKLIICSNNLESKTDLAKTKLPFVKACKDFDFDVDINDYLDYNIKPNDPACIIMTGGTTGRSKGAVLSHTALMAGMINGCYGLSGFMKQRYYCIMPLTHVFGFIRNLLASIYTGSCIMFNTDKKVMFNEIPAFKPTILVIVPALAELFLNLIKAYTINVVGGNLKTIICGAASVPPYLVKEYHKLGIIFCGGYGLTEFANMVSGNPKGLEYPDSVGMLFPDQEAKIVNGELWLKGRNMMMEYYNEPEENKNAFVDGWFKTGDLARFDENNYLYIIGRCKDVIVLQNGENVSPAYIESKINELDFIQDSLVTDTNNEFGHQILQVEIVLRNSVFSSLNIKEEDKQAFVENEINKINQTLQDFERVSKVVIRDKDFDRTPAMKIIRPKKVY